MTTPPSSIASRHFEQNGKEEGEEEEDDEEDAEKLVKSEAAGCAESTVKWIDQIYSVEVIKDAIYIPSIHPANAHQGLSESFA